MPAEEDKVGRLRAPRAHELRGIGEVAALVDAVGDAARGGEVLAVRVEHRELGEAVGAAVEHAVVREDAGLRRHLDRAHPVAVAEAQAARRVEDDAARAAVGRRLEDEHRERRHPEEALEEALRVRERVRREEVAAARQPRCAGAAAAGAAAVSGAARLERALGGVGDAAEVAQHREARVAELGGVARHLGRAAEFRMRAHLLRAERGELARERVAKAHRRRHDVGAAARHAQLGDRADERALRVRVLDARRERRLRG